MAWVFPIDPPGVELWVHAGPAANLFPMELFRFPGANPYFALQAALNEQKPVLLISRMSSMGLHYAKRNQGVCLRSHLPSIEHYKLASVVTTSFYDGERCILGCLKNRDANPFNPFDFDSGSLMRRTMWDHLKDPS